MDKTQRAQRVSTWSERFIPLPTRHGPRWVNPRHVLLIDSGTVGNGKLVTLHLLGGERVEAEGEVEDVLRKLEGRG